MRLVACVLTMAICPGAAEATEDLAHWVAEGHTVHSPAGAIVHDHVQDHDHDADHDQPAGHDRHEDDEHGCSPLFHLCGCHSATASLTSALLVLERGTGLHREVESLFASDDRRPSDDVVGEAFRPPIC